MMGIEGFIVPAEEQVLIKKKTMVYSSWVILNKDGEGKVLDLDKYSLLRRMQIHARDLRILDPLLSYPSTILGRDRAIVVNLEHIKAIITAEEVLLRDPTDEYVVPVVEELQRRLGLVGALYEGQGDEDEQGGAQFGEELDFPFEFRALEVMLEAICSHLDARTMELETDAYPALDELTSKISSRNLDRVRKLKSAMTRLTNRVQKVRDELEQLLDDDEDMSDLYLSRKISPNSSPNSGSYARNWCPVSPNIESKVLGMSRASGISTLEENDVEELEMLLEAYFMQIDSTMNKLITLREYIDDTEDYINIQLDNHRNQLIQVKVTKARYCRLTPTKSIFINFRKWLPPYDMRYRIVFSSPLKWMQLELFLSSGTVCLSVYSLIAAIFGMNIPYSWRENHGYLFKWVVILAGMISGSIFFSIMTYARYKGLVGT